MMQSRRGCLAWPRKGPIANQETGVDPLHDRLEEDVHRRWLVRLAIAAWPLIRR